MRSTGVNATGPCITRAYQRCVAAGVHVTWNYAAGEGSAFRTNQQQNSGLRLGAEFDYVENSMNSAVIGTKKKSPVSQHGGGVRGDSLDRRSSSFEGRFGRLFRSLPPAEWPKQALLKLAGEMTAEPEHIGNLPSASPEDPKKRIQDDEENAGIPAGYTYLGQFIDHDITFDPSSSLMQDNDPDALVDFRTPRLDLDSL